MNHLMKTVLAVLFVAYCYVTLLRVAEHAGSLFEMGWLHLVTLLAVWLCGAVAMKVIYEEFAVTR